MKREGYISNHVVSVVLAGEQQIRTYDENLIRVKQGEVLFIPRGMYYITDLLPKEGTFKSLLFYFNPYEIAPYALGGTLLELKLTDYVNLIKDGSVIEDLKN